MKLYHFTAVEYLPAIAREGLSKGEVPLGYRRDQCLNAVWFTTESDPGNGSDHGLTDGRQPTKAERDLVVRFEGVSPPPGARFANKRRIRLMVDISDDPALRNWGEWAVANGVSRQHRRSLNKAGGGKDQTWWLYFGVLPATCFYLTDMATGREFDDWPELAEAIRLLPMDVFEQQDIVGFIEHHLAIVETGA